MPNCLLQECSEGPILNRHTSTIANIGSVSLLRTILGNMTSVAARMRFAAGQQRAWNIDSHLDIAQASGLATFVRSIFKFGLR